MAPFVTFRVGRSLESDLVLDDPGISRKHMEITLTSDQRYFVVDCGTTGGTRVQRNGEWKDLSQDFIAPAELLELGDRQYRFAELIARLPARSTTLTKQPEPLSVRPRRKSSTGEVEFTPSQR
ncbi:hypothetical protein CK507_01255 [Pseudomonas sp. WN033]|nr:hypothetical protein CK507_01255 [Pseudomonas sp. WN033]